MADFPEERLQHLLPMDEIGDLDGGDEEAVHRAVIVGVRLHRHLEPARRAVPPRTGTSSLVGPAAGEHGPLRGIDALDRLLVEDRAIAARQDFGARGPEIRRVLDHQEVEVPVLIGDAHPAHAQTAQHRLESIEARRFSVHWRSARHLVSQCCRHLPRQQRSSVLLHRHCHPNPVREREAAARPPCMAEIVTSRRQTRRKRTCAPATGQPGNLPESPVPLSARCNGNLALPSKE